MIIECDNFGPVDTALLTPEERHIIQKLMAWKSLSATMPMFRAKTTAALETGWNNSGPVARTRALSGVIEQFEKELRHRLNTDSGGF